MFVPIEKMWERIEIARDDNDMSLFMNLLYLGEMVLKIVVAGLTASIDQEKNRNRYRIIHGLIRADGLGEWVVALDDILIGPAAQYLSIESQQSTRELTEKVGKGNWQYEALELLTECLEQIEDNLEKIPVKSDGRNWFKSFVQLRNRTRAHGALQSGKCTLICEKLEKSIRLITENYSIFTLPWAYLHQNYSGKYRVSKISQNTDPFEYLKKSSTTNLPNLEDGVYIFLGENRYVDLIQSDPDLFDFYLPNGQFTDKKYEQISYITDTQKDGDSTRYILPASELPESETQGKISLDILGQGFSNLPQSQIDYIPRLELEKKLSTAILSDNHPMITLRGRGGIGKTWLTLHVLQQISKEKNFDSIIWFSSRDIDLLSNGPKRVKPQVLDEKDIADVFIQLLNPTDKLVPGFKPIKYFQDFLTKSRIGPTLFVFDNFETVKNPTDLYMWLDTYLRLPNKALITTRVRDFKGDWDVEVTGMNDTEAEELIKRTSSSLGISKIITPKYSQELIQESEGHPYVIKILLGEVAKAQKIVKIERVIANSDDILKALFERTYNNLTPAAKRVFLTLVNIHSVVPQVALEAVLLRPENERINVINAVEELVKSSFVEMTNSEFDQQVFLSIPLVAVIFGEKKLAINPLISAIQSDTELLRSFGVTNATQIKTGLQPRLNLLFRNVAEKISKDIKSFNEYLPILTFVSTQYPDAWMLMATLYEENLEIPDRLEKARECIQFFLESEPSLEKKKHAWRILATYNRRLEDWLGEVHALVELSQFENVEIEEVSNYANRINALLKDKLDLESEAKSILILRLLAKMEILIGYRGNGTDYSRMAWLALSISQISQAKTYTEMGLQVEPDNQHIQSLAKKLLIL